MLGRTNTKAAFSPQDTSYYGTEFGFVKYLTPQFTLFLLIFSPKYDTNVDDFSPCAPSGDKFVIDLGNSRVKVGKFNKELGKFTIKGSKFTEDGGKFSANVGKFAMKLGKFAENGSKPIMKGGKFFTNGGKSTLYRKETKQNVNHKRLAASGQNRPIEHGKGLAERSRNQRCRMGHPRRSFNRTGQPHTDR
jgi:hypothetical protein